MSIGEVWLATQIPPFWGLFSLLKTWSQYQILMWSVRQSHGGEEAHWPVVIADGGRESSSTDPVAHHMDPLTQPELHPENTQRSMNEEGTVSMWEKKLDMEYIDVIGVVRIRGHLQFGSNPTADVPMTSQVRPMHARVILQKVEHVYSSILRVIKYWILGQKLNRSMMF